jgi:hypothetical protein
MGSHVGLEMSMLSQNEAIRRGIGARNRFEPEYQRGQLIDG